MNAYWEVPLSNILNLSNPAQDDIWDCGVITEDDILTCYDWQGSWESYDTAIGDSMSKEWNVRRIVYLADAMEYVDPMTDAHPITIHLESPEDKHHPIIDGNHRIVSAHILRMSTLIIKITGNLSYAEQVLKPIRKL